MLDSVGAVVSDGGGLGGVVAVGGGSNFGGGGGTNCGKLMSNTIDDPRAAMPIVSHHYPPGMAMPDGLDPELRGTVVLYSQHHLIRHLPAQP